MHDKLIITLILHPKFGYMLQPFFATFQHGAESYTMTETATPLSSSFRTLSADEKTIVKLAERYSDKNLMKSFSKEKITADFLEKVSPELIENYIRPFVEKRHREIIPLIRETKTPLFLREKSNIRDFRASHLLELLEEASKMVCIFLKRETFTYHVKVENGGLNVELFDQFFAPLVSDPAVVVIGRQLHYFLDIDEKKLKPFTRKKQIEVPEHKIPDYIRSFVLPCIKKYDTRAEGLNIFEQKYLPVPVVSLETDFDLQPVIDLKFRYGPHSFPVDRPYHKEVQLLKKEEDFSIGWFYRDCDWEKAQICILTENGLQLSRDGFFRIAAGEEKHEDALGVVEWMNHNGEILKNFECVQAKGKLQYYTGEIDLQINSSDKNDWFDLECIVCFDTMKLPFIRFKNHILNHIREFVLPDGSIAVLPKEWFARFDAMFRYGATMGETIRLKKHHFRIRKLVEKGSLPVRMEFTDLGQTEPPDALKATLRPYQLEGFLWLCWLRRNHFGGCLADDMGLGKTLQTIALMLRVYGAMSARPSGRKGIPRQLSLFDEYDSGEEPQVHVSDGEAIPSSLIVMPTSLIHNWLNEFGKFAPSLRVYVHGGADRLRGTAFMRKLQRVDIVLTSYGVVRQDIDMLGNAHFHYVILDESQYIKNPFSQIFFCVKQLQASHRLVLTGTPIENGLTDLWAQMDFLNAGILGSHQEFKSRFPEKEVMGDDAEREVLFKMIEPFILRRTKEEVAPELPLLTNEVIYCEMDEEQKTVYVEEKNRIRNALLIEQAGRVNGGFSATALAALTRLRLLANHPAIIMPDYMGGSAKFEQVIELIDILFAEQHKVLIFSSFVKHLNLFADYFRTRNWPYAWLTGSTIDREAAIDYFNAHEDVRAFFISLKAGGTGLNLTAADYVFILDPWWNPAAELQAVSRAHRIGQQKKVTLYRFITKDTIEEKIQRLQQQKNLLADGIIRPHLSPEVVQELLK